MTYYKVVTTLVIFFIILAEISISLSALLLPGLKDDFAISDQIAQLSVSSSIFMLGFSGILYGSLSESFGRRPMFLLSMVLFTVSTLLCMLAPNYEIFLAGRILQGAGCGAGWVVGNACLKDMYNSVRYVQVMNLTHAIAGIMPAVAPIFCCYLISTFGWRSCFLLLLGLSIPTLAAMIIFQVETLIDRKKFYYKQSVTNYSALFKNRAYTKYLFLKVLSVMLLFCEIATVPLTFVDYYDVHIDSYFWYSLPMFCLYILASIISTKMAGKVQIDSLIRIGLCLIVISNGILYLAYQNIDLNPVRIQCFKSLCYMGWGFIFGNATAQIVSCEPKRAGLASAMMIALEMLFSAIGIIFIGYFFDGSLRPLSLYMVSWGCIGIICLRFTGHLQPKS